MVFHNPFKYPIKVVIFFARQAGGFKVKYDKAKRLQNKQGEVEYILKKTKPSEIPPIKYADLTGDDTLLLYCDTAGNYLPMTLNKPTYGDPVKNAVAARSHVNAFRAVNGGVQQVVIKPPEIKGVDRDVMNWAINASKKRLNQFKNPGFLEKYGVYIGTVSILIAVGVMVYISLGKIIELEAVAAPSIGAIRTSVEALTQTTEQLVELIGERGADIVW